MSTITGVRHFLMDNAPLVEPKPHDVNPFQRDGKPSVVKIRAEKDIKGSVMKALSLLGGMETVIKSGDKVFIKPNFNSDDPFPASTDLPFLRAVTELLLDRGARVTIGEWSGVLWQPTRRVFKNLGVDKLADSLGVELIAFDEHPDNWVRIAVNGDYLKSVPMPRSAYEADKLVYLPCMKTHKWARYTGALKLVFGFTPLAERRECHLSHLEQKIAEISLCWQPDIIIKDGRKAFVSGGPASGELVEPGLILASGDLVAIDVEAVKTLLGYKAENLLPQDPYQLPLVVHALKHGIGRRDYTLIEES